MIKKIIITTLFVFFSISFQQKVFPNIKYLGSGYDLVYGNPHATKDRSNGIDPGFRAPIFRLDNYSSTRKTPDERYNLPNGVNAESCTMCSLDVSTTIISGGYSYFESIKDDVSVDVGIFWVFSFRASEDSQYIFEFSFKYKDVFSSSHAVCCVYIASLDEYDKPDFSNDFINEVNQLPTNYDEEIYANFIKKFGTHVITKTSMGSRWGQVTHFSEVSYYQMSSSNFDIEVGAKFSLIVSAGVTLTDIQRRHVEFFKKYSKEQFSYQTGGYFPKNFDLHTWSEQSKKNPMPLKMTLETLDTYLNQQYFPHDININQKSQNLKMALNGYCNYLVKKGAIHSCQALPPDPALPKPATFGGFFQMDEGNVENIPNPYTGQTNCMNGYRPYDIAGYLRGAGGGWGVVQYVCISNANNRPDGIYGGSYSVWYNPSPIPLKVNPFTNGINCPPGYNSYLTSTTKSTTNYGVNIFVCLNTSVPVGVVTMAGLYQTGFGLKVINPYTGAQNCPSGYMNFPVAILRNPNYEQPTIQYVCLNNVFQ